ncbi:hypothetical protein OGH69_03870 [Flavobacterium sp. MFBS3-15]|uniref:hypothetical protein n=1 Tax=Flavobacterium sp. MFBS3-15 TaxID=2989816 RepID=UPI002235FDE5|nr:hypothetical protein [Flavobacterium sp. MFBS3-15]MCW4468093.1 hypothetical protein [Flavobacterium sp. MFBS3-15]
MKRLPILVMFLFLLSCREDRVLLRQAVTIDSIAVIHYNSDVEGCGLFWDGIEYYVTLPYALKGDTLYLKSAYRVVPLEDRSFELPRRHYCLQYRETELPPNPEWQVTINEDLLQFKTIALLDYKENLIDSLIIKPNTVIRLYLNGKPAQLNDSIMQSIESFINSQRE